MASARRLHDCDLSIRRCRRHWLCKPPQDRGLTVLRQSSVTLSGRPNAFMAEIHEIGLFHFPREIVERQSFSQTMPPRGPSSSASLARRERACSGWNFRNGLRLVEISKRSMAFKAASVALRGCAVLVCKQSHSANGRSLLSGLGRAAHRASHCTNGRPPASSKGGGALRGRCR
jgi:hypothetical protein